LLQKDTCMLFHSTYVCGKSPGGDTKTSAVHFPWAAPLHCMNTPQFIFPCSVERCWVSSYSFLTRVLLGTCLCMLATTHVPQFTQQWDCWMKGHTHPLLNLWLLSAVSAAVSVEQGANPSPWEDSSPCGRRCQLGFQWVCLEFRLCDLLAVRFWTCFSASLCLSSLICKTVTIVSRLWGSLED
jgi:hypothetical protein